MMDKKKGRGLLVLPDFNEFLATLTPDVISQICDDANLKIRQLARRPNAKPETMLGNQVGILSLTMALELLGLYHKWLEQSA